MKEVFLQKKKKKYYQCSWLVPPWKSVSYSKD